MAVYTKITDAEFSSALKLYNIGDFKLAKGIAEGVENTNYLLETTHNKYIATIYEKRVNVNELPFFLKLMQHFSQDKIPSPLPVYAINGDLLQDIQGKKFSIVSFLSGKSVKRISNNHCFELGKMLANMHNSSLSFEMSRENNMSLPMWQEMFSEIKSKTDSFKVGISKEIEKSLSYIADKWAIAEKSNLPRGIIHADLFPDNVFFTDNKVTGVLDFYFACNDFFVHDVAITMNAWCFEHGCEFNITKARNLLRGYNSVRKFTDDELKMLPVFASGAAMRFLLSRLYDLINRVEGAEVTPKDPTEYLKKLRFHMHIKSASEYGL